MMRILGCWYSTAQIHPQILESSLRSIEAACQASRLAHPTVKTCCWRPIPGNPFDEYLAHHHLPNHLGIAMQMARILIEEQQAGRTYDLVCFLEHDVLYPHDYFEQVATFFSQSGEDIQGIRNENYVGLNDTGWLAVRWREEPPLHQLSLRWDFARHHVESLLQACLLHGSVRLEPAESKAIIRYFLPCAGPACHINHNRHFTDHHLCYERQGHDRHVYWGDSREYYPAEDFLVPRSPRICSGVVIGHYNRPDFLELNLRAIRACCGPEPPILISDDCSDGFAATPDSESIFARVLHLAETVENVAVWPNPQRIGHTGGDMATFWKGLVWGGACGLRVVFKLSQRYVIIHPDWIDESACDLVESGSATLGRSCTDGAWPIRTEAVGLLVPAWHQPGVLSHLTPRRVQWPTELIVWDDIVDRLDGRLHPWELVTEGRFTPSPRALFHYANSSQDYQNLATKLGMSLPSDFDCNQVRPNYLLG